MIVAGPPGSGKSRAFPVANEGIDYFNADDQCARLNGGSYHGITQEIRREVNRLFEAFILEHIANRQSLAIETTLRTAISLDQARLAREHGFVITMRYLATENVETNVKRIVSRYLAGGHAASPGVIRATYQSSLQNLLRALRELDVVTIHDTTGFEQPPRYVMEVREGRTVFVVDDPPRWLVQALLGTEFDLTSPQRNAAPSV
jgi:predicted ABC-type ATPase